MHNDRTVQVSDTTKMLWKYNDGYKRDHDTQLIVIPGTVRQSIARRKINMKRGAFTGPAFGGDKPAVIEHYLFYNGETDAGT